MGLKPDRKNVHSILVILVVLGGGAILMKALNYPAQEEGTPGGSKEEGNAEALDTVRIGVLSSNRSIEKDTFLGEIARGDINEYCNESGKGLRFEFVYKEARFDCDSALLLAEWYKENGIDLIVGPRLNINLCGGTPVYVRDNGMVMLSPSIASSYWDFAFGPDYPLFRLCPSETAHVGALLEMMDNLGVSSVFVVIQNDASSGDDSILAAFEESLTGMGGTVRKTPKYTYTFEENFTSYLDRVEPELQDLCQEEGREHTGVLMITGGAEGESIVTQAASYQTLMNVTWFSSEKSSFWPHHGFNESDITNIKLFSPIMKPRYSSLYERVNQTFFREFDLSLGYYDANIYDCCWVMALSVLEAGTADGTEVVKVLPEVASSYQGVTGPCSLNERGERAHVDYDIRGFFDVNGTYEYLKCGFYDGSTGTITWDEALMGGAAKSG
jgi:ABC-type branched-subunit amino acid transport system substrate-binding protein